MKRAMREMQVAYYADRMGAGETRRMVYWVPGYMVRRVKAYGERLTCLVVGHDWIEEVDDMPHGPIYVMCQRCGEIRKGRA